MHVKQDLICGKEAIYYKTKLNLRERWPVKRNQIQRKNGMWNKIQHEGKMVNKRKQYERKKAYEGKTA